MPQEGGANRGSKCYEYQVWDSKIEVCGSVYGGLLGWVAWELKTMKELNIGKESP